jgi:hypothetical protein
VNPLRTSSLKEINVTYKTEGAAPCVIDVEAIANQATK